MGESEVMVLMKDEGKGFIYVWTNNLDMLTNAHAAFSDHPFAILKVNVGLRKD